MKKAFFLLFAFVFITLASKAQDVITLNDGTKIQAKVLEINPSDIKYKDYSNQDGPTITIRKDGVNMIEYANGTKTVFNDPYNKNTAGGTISSSSGAYQRPNSHGQGRDPGRNHGNGYKKRAEKNYLHGWYFGAGINIGISNATSADQSYTTSGSGYSGLNICATKMFSQHLGIQFGIAQESFSYDLDFTSTSNYPGQSDNFTLNSFTIPVRALYFSNSKHRCGLYVSAGFDFSFSVTGRDLEGDDITSYYNPVMISPYVSAGVEFRNKNAHSVWMFGPYYKTSVNNCYSGKIDNNNNGLFGLATGNTGTLNSVGLAVVFMHNYSRR